MSGTAPAMADRLGAPPPRRISAGSAVLLAGLTGGAGDLLLAMLLYRNATFMGILHSIASGLIGRAAARGGGVPTAALGLVLHFFIATTAALVFYAASRKLPALVRHAVPFGLAFGAAIYGFMNYVVVPLSMLAAQGPTRLTGVVAGGLLGHMVLIGLPIALIVRQAHPRRF